MLLLLLLTLMLVQMLNQLSLHQYSYRSVEYDHHDSCGATIIPST